MPPFLQVSARLWSSSQRELARAGACGRVTAGVCAADKWSCQLEPQVTVPWELLKAVCEYYPVPFVSSKNYL